MKTQGWFLHPDHGYMLRGPDYGDGWQTVVTSLVNNNIENENDPALWQNHVNRLHVNAGCGAVAADGMRVGDHNPEFKPISIRKVPNHIIEAFSEYLA